MHNIGTLASDVSTADINATCKTCGQNFEYTVASFSWAPAIKPPDECEQCTKERIEKEQQRREKDAWREIAIDSGIPAEFIEWSREKGNIELMGFVWSNRAKSLLVIDQYGTNKSRCMAAAAAKMIHDNPRFRVSFWSFPALVAEYSGRMQDGIIYAERLKNDLMRADLLVIDDIGKKKITDSACDLLYAMIDGRYVKNAAMWLSANLPVDKLARKFPDADIANACSDRLRRMIDDGNMNRWDGSQMPKKSTEAGRH